MTAISPLSVLPNKRKSHNPAGRRGLYTKGKGAKIAALMAAGATMKGAATSLGLDPRTVYAWRSGRPEFVAAIDEARRARALALEDQALGATLRLMQAGEGGGAELTPGQVKALDVGLKSMRHLMAVGDPRRFGGPQDRGTPGVTISIHTTLDLGPEDQEGVFELRASVPRPVGSSVLPPPSIEGVWTEDAE
jgi:hypothetical protein